MSIEELEHTADLRFRIRAPTLEGLFAEATRALMETLYGDTGGPVIETRTVEVSAADREALLHDLPPRSFAEENLVSRAPTCSGAALRSGPPGTQLTRPLRGRTEVKGIAYFDLSIVEADGEYRLEIVFDV
jgi:SHS2 domain-containing protein